MSMCLALLSAGDHVVVSRNVFGSTASLFSKIFLRFGVDVTFVELTDMHAWREAIHSKTRLLILETPSNPLTEIADIRALADLAHAHGCKLVIDNVLCTPALQRPIEFGADIVVHSATKYVDGQGRCVGGAVVCAGKEDYDKIFGVLRTAGTTMSPFNAWVFLKGLETLSLRMRAHSEAATRMAVWLESHTAVHEVFYPGLESHPQHALAARQQSGFSGIVAFRIKGGQAQAWEVVDHCQLISITANFGDAKSTITHPATTTHGRLSDDERAAARVTPDLLRFSVGLEDIADLQTDLSRGLDIIAGGL
jgi:O-succinylhomoserine sulfhydrylase